MVAGHLQSKKGYYYMVLTYTLPDGTPTAKWRSTGLKVRGNKLKATNMLLEFRQNFVIQGLEEKEVLTHIIPKAVSEEGYGCGPKEERQEVPTVKEYILTYMDGLKNSISDRTWETRMNFANHIISKLGKYKVTELTKTVAKRFLNDFAATPYVRNKKGEKAYYSQETINKITDLLKNIIYELLEDEYLQKDIMARVKRPKTKRPSERKNEALNAQQVSKILDIVKEDLMLNVMIHMLLLLGIRPGELFALKWSDIDRVNRTIHIERTLSVTPIYDADGIKIKQVPIIQKIKNDNGQNNFAVRTLSFTPLIESLIDEWHGYVTSNFKIMRAKRKNKTTEYLFCNVKNGEMPDPQYYLRRHKYLLKKHGYKYNEFNFYRFRHTFATNALKSGLDLKTVQMLIGDNDPEMVLRIYANVNKKEILEAHVQFAKKYEATLGEIAM